MATRLRALAVISALICLTASQPTTVSAQRVAVGVGVGVGYPGPYHWGVGVHYPFYPGYRYGYPWYPYGGYPYPYPFYAQVYPYPYYDPFAGLRLQVTPRETEVFVDGYFAGVVDNFDGTFQRLDLAPGEHTVELFLPGHQPVQQRLYLQPGKTSRVKLAMQPLAAGEPEPVRPAAQPLPPPDPQQGAVRQPPPRKGPGPPPATIEVNPAPVPATPRDADVGGLAIRVQPAGASIIIDGERWEGPEVDERLVMQLAPGKHVIEIQKDGYRRYTTEITVRAGETTAINVAMTKQ